MWQGDWDMRKSSFMAAASAAAFVSSAAAAQVTQYTSEAAFNAAVGATSLQNFNSLSSGVTISPGPFSFGAFSTSTNGVASIAPGAGGFNVNGSNYLDIDLDPTESFTFTFAAPITSFGANFFSLNNGSPLRTSITVNGQTFGPTAEPTFLGFVSMSAFTTLTFSVAANAGTNDEFGLDNVRFATAGVPEPATWAMMVFGFGAMGGALRRRPTVPTRIRFA